MEKNCLKSDLINNKFAEEDKKIMNNMEDLKSGCNFFATKRSVKTAAIKQLSFPYFSTTTTITINYPNITKITARTITKIHLWAIIFIAITLLQTMPTKTNAMHISRHRRRHINHNSVEWENPCGGKYFVHNSADISTSSRKIAFRNLRRSIRANNQRLHDERLSAIDVSDIGTWVKLNSTYKFLAQVKPNSNINLTRWHRNLQVYVASFAYLRKRQDKVDNKYKYDNRPISVELRKLLNNAINVLCEIETAINATTNRTLQIITREEMERRLTFRTKLAIDSGNGGNIIDEVDQIDLKFVKARYLELLNGVGKNLKKWLKQQKMKKLCKLSMNHSGGYENSSNINSSISSSISSSSSSLSSSSYSTSNEKNEQNPCKKYLRRRNRNLGRRRPLFN